MVEVGLQFFPTWVVCCEIPGLVDLGDVELVDWDGGVDTSAGIAVPSPVVFD